MTPTYYGYNVPFLGGPQNVMSRQTDERLIKNDILQLLLTVPGERVYRPTFGVNLRNFVFEPLTSQALSDLEQEITDKIIEFEERVTVNSVTTVADPDNHKVTVRVDVSPNDNPQVNYLIEVGINLPGG